ncbi:concanavalin A-like lectin/glucanase domain-containing protein [Tribonema minus]|uniref:Concanavalin A-like lectin/glucanase domain-containing protein n=1 Tax=Tribonema minus TaxID=303371 RepID=A0A836CC31_9STRA|nr:concanavalin A-like lectin/glucanase domain-containing protein [Tribonema minus]
MSGSPVFVRESPHSVRRTVSSRAASKSKPSPATMSTKRKLSIGVGIVFVAALALGLGLGLTSEGGSNASHAAASSTGSTAAADQAPANLRSPTKPPAGDKAAVNSDGTVNIMPVLPGGGGGGVVDNGGSGSSGGGGGSTVDVGTEPVVDPTPDPATDAGVDAGGTITADKIVPSDGVARKLLWHDEFQEKTLNNKIWETTVGNGCPANCFFGNGELQSYSEANVILEDGKLVLEGRFEDPPLPNGMGISSGKIHTRDAFAPIGNEYGGWPGSDELDIMESYNSQWADAQVVLGTLHYGWPDGATGNLQMEIGSRGVEHVFVVQWAPGSIKYYIDSLLYCEFTQWWAGKAVANKLAPYDKPFQLILNLAVGGTLPGAMQLSDIPGAAMPMRMKFDYVRVWDLTPEERAAANPFPGPILKPTPKADQVI